MSEKECGNNDIHPTWQWVAVTLVSICIMASGIFIGSWISDTKTEARLTKASIDTVKVAVDINGNRITALEANYANITSKLEENRETLRRLEVAMNAHLRERK